MGFKRSFIVGLLWRVVLLLTAAFLLVLTLRAEGFGAARLLTAFMCAAAIANLWYFVQRTNLELARFVSAVRFADLSQNFNSPGQGSGFGEFGEALEAGIRKLRDERHRLSDTNRFYEAVLDDAPTPLLTVSSDGKVELANKAARRLFVRHTGVRVEDFRNYGDAFSRSLTETDAGKPRLVPITTESVPQTAMVTASTVHRLGGAVRVVAVQPIQGELNAVEIAAQSDLVRVLTHEIMNSMTPVTSLAQTAAELMRSADDGSNREVSDARMAVETLARRADGVMNFVKSYRQISRTPEPRRRLFEVLPWARELEAIVRADERAQGVELLVEVDRDTLAMDADPDLMSQVLINLLGNAAEAASGHSASPRVRLRFELAKGARTQIEVSDNGPGVPEAIRHDVFLPFFTTKAKGTGVGLSLARQIVLAHRGSITLLESEEGGALFRILI